MLEVLEESGGDKGGGEDYFRQSVFKSHGGGHGCLEETPVRICCRYCIITANQNGD